jgi:hypothetical protein
MNMQQRVRLGAAVVTATMYSLWGVYSEAVRAEDAHCFYNSLEYSQGACIKAACDPGDYQMCLDGTWTVCGTSGCSGLE